MAKASADGRETRVIEIGPGLPSIIEAAERLARVGDFSRVSVLINALAFEIDQGRLEAFLVRAPTGWSKGGRFSDVDFIDRADGSVERIDPNGRRELTDLRVAEPVPANLYRETPGYKLGLAPAEILADGWAARRGLSDDEEEREHERLGRLDPRWKVYGRVHAELRYIVRACRRYSLGMPDAWYDLDTSARMPASVPHGPSLQKPPLPDVDPGLTLDQWYKRRHDDWPASVSLHRGRTT